jgi:hypothetical protein
MPRLPYRSDPFPVTKQGRLDLASAIRRGKEINKKGESNMVRPVLADHAIVEGIAYDFLDLWRDHVSCTCIGAVVHRDEAVRCGCDNPADDSSR